MNMKKKLLIAALVLCLLLAACQPAVQTIATPGNLVSAGNYVSPGNAVTPANAVSPGNAATPGDYVTPSNAEKVPADVNASEYPVLNQESMDKAVAAFFGGADTRYFSYDASDDNAPNVWFDKPLISTQNDGGGDYEIVDAKAYADGVVYDMWSYRRAADVGFTFGIYGRNLMSEEQIEALRPSDGIAWMSMQQGVIGGVEPALREAAAEKAIPQQDALKKAQEFLSAIGCAPVEPETTEATYRIRMEDLSNEEGSVDESLLEYGWLFTFHPLDYETVQIGVTAKGFGQFSWDVAF